MAKTHRKSGNHTLCAQYFSSLPFERTVDYPQHPRLCKKHQFSNCLKISVFLFFFFFFLIRKNDKFQLAYDKPMGSKGQPTVLQTLDIGFYCFYHSITTIAG